ncbi:hypothetical protein ACLOJK_034550 [Asimina triloba]
MANCSSIFQLVQTPSIAINGSNLTWLRCNRPKQKWLIQQAAVQAFNEATSTAISIEMVGHVNHVQWAAKATSTFNNCFLAATNIQTAAIHLKGSNEQQHASPSKAGTCTQLKQSTEQLQQFSSNEFSSLIHYQMASITASDVHGQHKPFPTGD